MGPRPGCSGLCPERKWSPQRSGGGHTSIAIHGYYRCSNTSYGGRCPVGQRPNSTEVEGWCLPDGWRLPRPWKFPGPLGVLVNPGGGLTPEREGWAPGRREIPGREMLNWSGRAGEPGGPAPFPLPCRGVVPAWWLAFAPTLKIPRTPRGAGESRGWPNSREGGLGPGQARDTRKGNAPWVRPIYTSMGVSPCTAAEWNDWSGKAERPERAESFTKRGCRAASMGWFRWPVWAVEAVPMDTSPILSDL